jgi:hypothetical protein
VSAADPTRDLVLKKLRQCFPEPGSAEGVLPMLDGYWGDSDAGRARVQLAILMQCGGDVSRLRELVRLAQADFRDVLVGAEYPEEFAAPSDLPPGTLEAIRKRDRERYEQWLHHGEP